MQKKVKFTSAFLVLLAISLLIFTASIFGVFRNAGSILIAPFSPIRTEAYRAYIKIITFGGSDTIESLKQENQNLRKQLVDQQRIQKDNSALRDQFQLTKISPNTLLFLLLTGTSSIPSALIACLYARVWESSTKPFRFL